MVERRGASTRSRGMGPLGWNAINSGLDRRRFDQQVRQAAELAGLPAPPVIRAQAPPAPPPVMPSCPEEPWTSKTPRHAIVAGLYTRSLGVLESVRSRGATDRPVIRHAPRFPITRAAELVGRTSAAIRDAEKDGRLPTVERTASGRRVGYTLAEINQMRAVFGTRPWRTAGDPSVGDCRAELQGGRRQVDRRQPSRPISRHQGLSGLL